MRNEQISWTHDWPFSSWVSLLLVVAIVGWTLWCYYRDRSLLGATAWLLLATLRIVALVGIFLAAWGWQTRRYETELPRLIVMIDLSESMTSNDGLESVERRSTLRNELGAPNSATGATRIEVAQLALAKQNRWLHRIDRRYDLRFYTVSDNIVPRKTTLETLPDHSQHWKADGKASRLGKAIDEIVTRVRGVPTAGIVFFTDGAVTSGPSLTDSAESARRRHLPIFFVGLGRRDPARDVRIESVVVDSPVFLDDTVRADVTVRTSGDITGPINVELRDSVTDELLATDTNSLSTTGDDGIAKAILWFEASEIGTRKLKAYVEPHPGEVDTENNSREFSVDVRDTVLNVLLVAAKPTWEYRLLKQLFERTRSERGAAVELTAVQQDADPEHARQDASSEIVVPVGRDALFAYDVIILLDADLTRIGQSTLQHLRAFVEQRGGGLVIGAGIHFFPQTFQATPLADFLPAAPDRFRFPSQHDLLTRSWHVEPTRVGIDHAALRLLASEQETRAIWTQLPALRWLAVPDGLAAGSQTLLQTVAEPSGESNPVVIWRYIGAGEVVFHATDETFLWSRFQGSQQYYERYWMQLVRQLGRKRLAGDGDPVILTTDRREYEMGETATVRLRFLSPQNVPATGVEIEWRSGDGRTDRLTLQRSIADPQWLVGRLPPLPPGSYELSIVQPVSVGRAVRATFHIRSAFGEQAHMERDDRAMRLAARISGGRVYEPDQLDELVKDLPKGRPTRVAALPPEPFWNRWPWLVLLAGVLLAEWTLRRWWSLA